MWFEIFILCLLFDYSQLDLVLGHHQKSFCDLKKKKFFKFKFLMDLIGNKRIYQNCTNDVEYSFI